MSKVQYVNVYIHVISKNTSMVVLVQTIQKLNTLPLMFKQPTVYGCRNLEPKKEKKKGEMPENTYNINTPSILNKQRL